MNAMSPKGPVQFRPDHANTRLLRDAFGQFATGVTVVTTASDEGPVGITANSFSSVSLDPALVLWAPSKSSRRFRFFSAAPHYAIHVLAADQAGLCPAFAQDAFALRGLPHRLNDQGVPVLDTCLARFDCKQVACYDGGDHVIVLGEVLNAEMREGDGLAFFAGKLGEVARQ